MSCVFKFIIIFTYVNLSSVIDNQYWSIIYYFTIQILLTFTAQLTLSFDYSCGTAYSSYLQESADIDKVTNNKF